MIDPLLSTFLTNLDRCLFEWSKPLEFVTLGSATVTSSGCGLHLSHVKCEGLFTPKNGFKILKNILGFFFGFSEFYQIFRIFRMFSKFSDFFRIFRIFRIFHIFQFFFGFSEFFGFF